MVRDVLAQTQREDDDASSRGRRVEYWRWVKATPEEKQAADPQRFASEQAAAATQQAKDREEKLRQLDDRLGPRYAGATLESYVVACDAQRAAVSALRGYADKLAEYCKEGRGIVLFGGCGTGKDHLRGALARIAVGKYGHTVEWSRGGD